MSVAAIRTVGLTKDYGDGRGIFGLEMQVARGEGFGVLGAEAAGKSTLIRLLMGTIRPTRGSVYVFGLDCVRESVEVKRRVGYMPDETPEFGALRGGEVVTYLAGFRGGVHRDRVPELAERFDLDLGRPHREYPRADRRKLAIVLAFMHEPELLILDEPAQDLGPEAANELHWLINEARDEGATVLMASRAAADIERECEAAGVLRRGRLSRVVRIEDLPDELEERSRKALPPPEKK